MKRFLSIFLAIFALSFAACTNSEEENGGNSQGGGNKPSTQPEVTITTQPTPTISAKGGNDIVAFHADKPWSAKVLNTRADGWCSIYPTSGAAGDVQITITTTPNDTADDRTATIVIQAGSTSISITITQKQADALTVTASKFEVDAEGGEVEIEVKANVDYDYTIDPDAADWIKYKATRALESSTLVFEVAENEDMDKREAQILIHSGDLEELVTIYQEGNEPTIILSKNEYTVSDKGETVAVEVKSNVDVAVEIPSDVDWISENATRAMSTNTFYLDVAPNEDYKSRSAAVKFTNKENGLSEIVMISQAQMDAIVIAKDSYTIDNEGGEIDIEVGHNVDFDIEISDSWITKTSTRAFETETLTFNIAANNSDDSREGTIKFTSKDKAITQTVKVYQSQSNALIVSKKDIVIDEAAQTVEFEVRANMEYTVSDPSASWLHRESTRAMTSQTIRYRVDANGSYDSRTATITVQSKDGSLKEIITVTQAQKDAIVLAKNSYTVDNDGGEIDIEVGHNVDFDIEISDSWITNTTTRAFETETLTFTIAANNSDDSREGTIKFTSKDKAITQTVKVYQSQSNALIVSKKDIVIDEAAQTVEFEVRANVEYTVSDPSASWLHRESTRAMTSQTIRYRVDANSDYNSRTATITVQSKDGSLKETITVTQAQKDAIVLAKNSYTVDNDGGKIDIEVGHNVDFDIEISDSWITNTTTRAFETETLTFTIAANNSDNSREGTIKFISKDKSISQMVKVLQKSNYDPTKPRNNEIWYTSTDGKIVTPYATNVFGANIVSNTYENGKGIIKFDNEVKQVGFDAFWQCTNIKSITLPEGIESLGDSSFYQCENLEHIDIPDSVMSIGRFVFCYCYGLKDITIPNGVISIGQETFAHCTGLTTITLPESISEVGEGLFSECSNLTSFYGKFATADHSSLIANGTFIALAMNSGLTEVYVPEGVTAIGMGAFRKNSNLSFISLPSSLTRIGAYAFQYCQNLSNVAIPEQVYSIGYWAFFNCESFTSVTIPNSVTELAEGAFSYCYNIQEFHGKYTTSDHCCLIVDGRLEAFAVKSGVTSYVIPNTVSEIPDGVFSTCPSISELTIPESVNKIGNYAFQVCSNLKSIRLKSTTPPTIFDATFSNVRSSFIIYVPAGCANIYKNADIWKNHQSIILEEGEEIYSSTDYSQDGKVTKLQSATKGNGIDIVLMGDAFTDRLIADGTYEKTMRTAMEKFFTEEPYKSYRDHFNVYSVTAVSKNDIYGEGNETAFSGFFGGGTHVGGDNNKVFTYALKAISADRIDKSLMIVMMNSTSYAGTCYMYYTDSGDYGNGASISYFPIGADETALEQVLHHEAGGHGFAKLGDEYAYEEYGTIPAEEVQSHAQMEPYGWWKNADFTNNPSRVKWAHFLSDTRYANDGLGVFEGGLTFWRGVWRPTENSIMRYNTGGFNAPSREAIYYRIHKLAYGESWQYDYEKFVEWDAKNRKTAATRGVPYRIEQPKNFKPLAPPVVINHTWREAR